MIEQFAEASMFTAGGVHDALGAVLSLWDSLRMPRPHFFAAEIGEDAVPCLRIGKAEFVRSQTDNVAVLAMDFRSVMWKATRPLPVILSTPKDQKAAENWRMISLYTHGNLLMRQMIGPGYLARGWKNKL